MSRPVARHRVAALPLLPPADRAQGPVLVMVWATPYDRGPGAVLVWGGDPLLLLGQLLW